MHAYRVISFAWTKQDVDTSFQWTVTGSYWKLIRQFSIICDFVIKAVPPSLVSRKFIISHYFYLVCAVGFRSGLRDFDRLFWKMFWTRDAITKKDNIAVNAITTVQFKIEVKNWLQGYLFQNWHHRSLKMIKLKVLEMFAAI